LRLTKRNAQQEADFDMKSVFAVQGIILAMLAAAGAIVHLNHKFPVVAAQPSTRFAGPTSSQPRALSADPLLAGANPDNNSVTLFDVSGQGLAANPVTLNIR
jgi:hypothetical protein